MECSYSPVTPQLLHLNILGPVRQRYLSRRRLEAMGSPYNMFALTVTNPFTRTQRNATRKRPRAEHGRYWCSYLVEDSGYHALVDRYRLGAKILMRKLKF